MFVGAMGHVRYKINAATIVIMITWGLVILDTEIGLSLSTLEQAAKSAIQAWFSFRLAAAM